MPSRCRALLTLPAVLAVFCAWFLAAADSPTGPATKVGDFRLGDPRDQKAVTLADLKDKKAVVVVFVGTECPLSNAYLPRLAELHREYSPKGVQFLGINSNTQDTSERVAEHARKHEVPFPVLKDLENKVADQFGATRMSEAFVLGPDGAVLYRGRIDDQFGIGYQRPAPTSRDLARALEEVLAGKAVSVPATEAVGCKISRVVATKAEGPVTYTKQVARVIQNRCQECHRPGRVAPFALMNYEDALSWSDTIREVVQEGRMPPWHADPKYGTFSNDRRLPAADREALLKWVEAGCPKGDDRDLPPPREWAEGWGIGKPDQVVTMKEAFEVPAEAPKGGIPYKYFRVDTDFAEDRWVVAAEAKPGAPQVVHHILVFISTKEKPFVPDRPGNVVLCGVAPGDNVLRLPDGVAKRIPAKAQLVFQMHYTPNGKATKDQSSLGLVFRKTPPDREAYTVSVFNAAFRIPAGAENYKVESSFTFKEDGHVLGFMPHMHLRGKDFLYEAVHPDGRTEVLLSVPRFNFGWQTSYRLAEPYAMPKGSVVRCVAHFDNSAKNPNNPDPKEDVYWGDQTWEEMMIGWMEYVYDRKPDVKAP